MAVMTDEQRVRARRLAARYAAENGIPINYPKGAWNDAVQAVIDRFNATATQNAISTDINNATAPYSLTMSAAQKRLAFAVACLITLEQEGLVL